MKMTAVFIRSSVMTVKMEVPHVEKGRFGTLAFNPALASTNVLLI